MKTQSFKLRLVRDELAPSSPQHTGAHTTLESVLCELNFTWDGEHTETLLSEIRRAADGIEETVLRNWQWR